MGGQARQPNGLGHPDHGGLDLIQAHPQGAHGRVETGHRLPRVERADRKRFCRPVSSSKNASGFTERSRNRLNPALEQVARLPRLDCLRTERGKAGHHTDKPQGRRGPAQHPNRRRHGVEPGR